MMVSDIARRQKRSGVENHIDGIGALQEHDNLKFDRSDAWRASLEARYPAGTPIYRPSASSSPLGRAPPKIAAPSDDR
jgi:hypothetical protein